VIFAQGNIGITWQNTTVAVSFDAVQGRPDYLDIMISGGTISSWCKNNPQGYNGRLTSDRATYYLERPSRIGMSNTGGSEGENGSVAIEFSVNLSHESGGTLSVDYTTANGAATTGDNDYAATSGTLTFEPGETTKLIVVYLTGDQKYEQDETFFVYLSNPTDTDENAEPPEIEDDEGVGTVVNDDPLPSIWVEGVALSEGNSGTMLLTFTINLTNTSYQTINVNYATADDTATVANNDYVATSGSFTFNPGETVKTFTVQVNGDTTYEADEFFLIILSNIVNAFWPQTDGTGGILNDD
jgi:hypothetical protein